MSLKLAKCMVCLTLSVLVIISWVTCPLVNAAGESKAAETRNKNSVSQEALEEFNLLIGAWRGSGQPKRGSTRGAWLEKAEWVWEFDDGTVGIRYNVDKGKIVDTALLAYDAKAKQFTFELDMPDKSIRKYTGNLEKDSGKKDPRLILESKPDDDGYVHRIRITRLNFKRTLVLFERRRETQKFYSRVAEVGYTRQGTRLASSDVSGPICIVTGGAANGSVTFKGKKYYICCSGCREAFNDDPEGIIARAAQKAKARKAEAEKAKSKS